MKLKDQLKLQSDIEVPHHVWVAFGEQAKRISLAGNQASFGEDYMDIEGLRTAIEWYVEQLGGKVKWEK